MTLEIWPALLGKPLTLKTRMLHERVRVFIPFKWTKSQSMKLSVAPLSKRALTEWSLLVSIVLISTGRSKKVPHASKVLIKRSLGSLLSHLVLRSGAETRGMRDGVSTSSLSIVLGSSIVNTVNLATGAHLSPAALCKILSLLWETRLFNWNYIFQCQQIFNQLLLLFCSELTDIHAVRTVSD